MDFIERKNRMEIVQGKEYKEWLYAYLLEHNSVYDDEYLYKDESIDRTNSMLLSYFHSYVEKLARDEGIEAGYDEECYFDNFHFIIQLKDIYIKLETVIGQGSMTLADIVEPQENCIKIAM